MSYNSAANIGRAPYTAAALNQGRAKKKQNSTRALVFHLQQSPNSPHLPSSLETVWKRVDTEAVKRGRLGRISQLSSRNGEKFSGRICASHLLFSTGLVFPISLLSLSRGEVTTPSLCLDLEKTSSSHFTNLTTQFA